MRLLNAAVAAAMFVVVVVVIGLVAMGDDSPSIGAEGDELIEAAGEDPVESQRPDVVEPLAAAGRELPRPVLPEARTDTGDPDDAAVDSGAEADGDADPVPRVAPTTSTPAAPTTAVTAERTGGGTSYFSMQGPGATLRSSAECAALVRPVPENVPENAWYNQTRGRPVTGSNLSNFAAVAENDFEGRIDGGFTGTTDEIIQWAACKWGFDEDMIRAQAYAESSWYAGKLSDCGENAVERAGGNGGCVSVGLIQVKSADVSNPAHVGVYPVVHDSTAMNLDYALATMRLCYEGKESWLSQSGDYRAGDEWACLGRWFSGAFRDGDALAYIAKVRDILSKRPWEGQWVGCPEWQANFHCSGIDR